MKKKINVQGTEFVFNKAELEDEIMAYRFIVKDQLIRYAKIGKKDEEVKKHIKYNMGLIRKHLKKKGL